jgi:hypothetical protein
MFGPSPLIHDRVLCLLAMRDGSRRNDWIELTMVSSSSLSGSVSETLSLGSAVIETDGPAAGRKLTIATSSSLSGSVSEMITSSGGCTVVERASVRMPTTVKSWSSSGSESNMFLRSSGSNSVNGTGLVATCSGNDGLV